MARTIQPSNSRSPGLKAFLGPLMAAAFWVVIALKFPVERIPDWVPAMAPFAKWVTPLFLVLALWAFLRSGRALTRIANSRHARAPRAGRLPQTGGRPGLKTSPKATPTVQRMR